MKPNKIHPTTLRALIVGAALATLITDRMNAQAPEAAAAPAAPAHASAPKVEVEAKIVEVPEAAVKQLGLAHVVSKDSGRGTDTASPNGILDANQAPRLLERTVALGETVDLLSAPRATIRSGQSAVIEVVREVIYPTEFDRDPHTASGMTPKKFETRNVGVTLDVQPTVGADGTTIDLNLKPQVVELVGYTRVRDGQPIPLKRDPKKNGLDRVFSTTLPKDVVAQPIFSARNITTSVSLSSGQSVLLGGLKETSAEGGKEPPRYLFVLMTARVVNKSSDSPQPAQPMTESAR